MNLCARIIVPFPCGSIQSAVTGKGITDVGKVDIFSGKTKGESWSLDIEQQILHGHNHTHFCYFFFFMVVVVTPKPIHYFIIFRIAVA